MELKAKLIKLISNETDMREGWKVGFRDLYRNMLVSKKKTGPKKLINALRILKK